jgi:DNA-binding NtrC family response regulator
VGAYTGATNRIGQFKAAHGGTLFIDELQDLSWEHQGKLRDFLDNKLVQPLGSTKCERVNVRFILGMNQNPKRLVEGGRFRADLFRRLGQNIIRIPPLRQRKEDIPEIAYYAVKKTCEQYGLEPKKLSPAALVLLQEHDWPGNVGELLSMIENAVLYSEDGIITAEQLRQSLIVWDLVDEERTIDLSGPTSFIAKVEQRDLASVVNEFERELIVAFLNMNDRRIRQTACALGIAPSTLEDKMKKYGLRKRERQTNEKMSDLSVQKSEHNSEIRTHSKMD